MLALYEAYIEKLILGGQTGRRDQFPFYFSSFPTLNLTNIQTLQTAGENAQALPIWSFLNMVMHSSRSDLTLRLAFWQPRELARLIEHPVMQRIVTLEIGLGMVFRSK
jgi:hypothetical protein